MILSFIRNKNSVHADAISPIKKMLEGTWDFSKQFQLPENRFDAEAVSTFNLFFGKLNQVVTAILKNVVNLAGLAPDLFKFSKSFKTKAEEQARGIADISRAAQDMTERLKETADNSQEISEDAMLIESEVKEALQLGKDSMEKFSGIQSHVRGLVDTITILEENSVSIGSITEVIHDIADETNILSLNARIEAAKNDSNRKGFKIIAEEISELSKQSQNAAQDIQSKLDVLTAKINETVAGVRMVEENVLAGEEMITRANASLTAVHERISRLSANMGAVKEAISLQSSDVENVSRDILAMEDVVNHQSSEVEEIFKAARQINLTCDEMILDTGIFHLSAHQKVKTLAEKMTSDPGILSFDRDSQETVLKEHLEANPFIELAYITDRNGRQVTNNIYAMQIADRESLDQGFGNDWSAKEWFQMPVRRKSAFVSKVYRSSATQNFCFTISVPLFDAEDLSGVLAIDINFTDLLNI